MKKLVTTLFLLAGLVAAGEANAQRVVPVGKPFIGKMPGKANGTIKDTRFDGPRSIKGAMAPLADDQYMLYVDLEGELIYWPFPRLINFSSGESDTLVIMFQRFTNPFPQDAVYLDSAFAFVQVNAVAEEAQTNNISFRVFSAQQPTENGNIYPALEIGSVGTRQRVDANTLELETISEISASYRTGSNNTRRKIDFTKTYTVNGETFPVHETDFFIGVQVPFYSDLPFDPENEDNGQNDIGIIGDQQPYDGSFDPEIHRAVALGFNYFVPWVGLGTAEESFYANFAIIAKVSDTPSAGGSGSVTSPLGNFKLEQNYPNPFNPSTKIEYSVDETLPVTIKVFNAMGVEVATLVNNEIRDMGDYSVNFDAINLPSGNYIYTMTAGGETITKAMTLSK